MRLKGLIFSLVLISLSISGDGLGTLVYPPFKHTWGIHKGTEGKLDMLLGNVTDFDNPQGVAVTRLDVWEDPDNEKDDDELTAYGVNAGRDQIIYNTSMYDLDIFGKTGSGKGEFDSPRGIAADPMGNVFICDTGNRRVIHLFNDGKRLEWSKSFGEDIFIEPHDVAVTESGTLFVTDRASGKIEVFTYEGEHLRSLGGLVYPTGIAADHPMVRKTRYGDRCVFVIDGDGTQIRKMNYDGKVLATIRAADMPIEEGEFSYLALDFYDNAWVTDSVTCQIHKLDKDLRYITSFGQCGDDDYEFDHPTGIAIWRRFGQMVIAERHSAQYLWIGSDISRLDAQVGVDNKGNPAVNIYIYLTDRSFLTVNVLKDDKVIAGLFDQRRFKQGARTLYWDMKDDKDRRVEPGKYTIQVKVEPTYSSFGYFDKTVSTEVEIP